MYVFSIRFCGFISFSFNTKSFAIAILVFFLSFFGLVQFFGLTVKSFLSNVFRIVFKRVCDKDLTNNITPNNIS